jgi:hypothetical protein
MLGSMLSRQYLCVLKQKNPIGKLLISSLFALFCLDNFKQLHIEYISEYNENGVRLSSCSIRNNRYETSNYPNGRIISVFERQYKKEGADYVTTIETTSDFYYYQGDYMYCAPNQLYQYTVYIENLATGEETFTAYDSNGNEM